MKLRFATWNIHGVKQPRGILKLLEDEDCSVVALQEVVEDAFAEIAGSGTFDWTDFSLRLRPPLPGEGKRRKLGCALLGKQPIRLNNSYLLPNAPVAERTLIAEVETPVGNLYVCSFHAPPGVTWGQVKPQTFIEIADWLSCHSHGTIFGIDANAPKVDHPIHENSVWWWKEEPVLLGVAPRHNLRDAYRTYLQDHPDRYEDIRKTFPQGPLAVSHMRGPASCAVPCRYDFVYASPDIEILNVNYLYEAGIRAGSDHAPVIVDMEIS